MKRKQSIKVIASALVGVMAVGTLSPLLVAEASSSGVGEQSVPSKWEATAEQLGGELMVTVPDEMVLELEGDVYKSVDYVHAEG